MQNYEHWKNKLASQDLEDFTSNPEAMLWLKIHSITKKDVMDDFVEANKIQLLSKKVEDKAVEIYNQIEEKDIQSWNNLLDKYFRDKNAEQLQALDIEQIKLDLRRIQHFKWGGDQNNSLDKYFVSHYVKAISSLDALNAKLGTEALPIVSNYVIASWYNHWSSIIIEHLFKKHDNVLPTVGQIKSIDFIVKGIPFDLKVTYLPKWYQPYIAKHLESKGLQTTELKALKQYAKKADIKYDAKLDENEQHYQKLSQLKDAGGHNYDEALKDLETIRNETIRYAISHKTELAKLMYENQGAMRFGSENRLYLVLIDKSDMQNSWEMKRDFDRLDTEITKYLNDFKAENLSNMEIDFQYSGKNYKTHADVLFVVK